MGRRRTWREARRRWLDALQARLAARARPVGGFAVQPEPRCVGVPARGRQLVAGNVMFAGHLIEAPGVVLWDLAAPEPAFAEAQHGFTWLDDLVAQGDVQARTLAQRWLWAWLDRHGAGTGPGWTAALAGQRLMRLLHHAPFLLRGTDPDRAARLFKTLAVHARFLSRRAESAPPGAPRIEALAALTLAAATLDGLDRMLEPARRALAAEAERRIDASGAVRTRAPEDALHILSRLTWVQETLEAARRRPDPAIAAPAARLAPALRALRHADGGLARFHGGGRGAQGRLDAALAACRDRRRPSEGLAMGFARLARGRTTVIVDAAPPPAGDASDEAHASTLAFELTSGRRPLIVSVGAGHEFGPQWRRFGRRTASHSTLTLAGRSSARIAGDGRLVDAPSTVPVQLTRPAEGQRFEGGHDGYVGATGLTHARTLLLSLDGRTLSGEDYLVALDAAARKRFDAALQASGRRGLDFTVVFHLHPDVDLALDTGASSASMALRSGEIWELNCEGDVAMGLEESAYLEPERLQPRATKQIVLTGRAMQYATRIRWSLAKARDTGLAVRDLVMDEADPFV